jgi:thiomorpholine-carboxylate dehydrogenase
MLVLNEEEVRQFLSPEELLPAMEKALIDFSLGRVQQPVRSVLNVPEFHGRWGLMPVVYGDVMGIKLVTVYEENSDRNLPTHQATIQLFSATNGEPLAVMDGRLITELRTAAVSAVATRLLTRLDARVLAILGSGVQAMAHVRALRQVREFKEIRIWSRTPENAERFAHQVGGRAMPLQQAVEGADVIVVVSSTLEPLVKGEWLSPHAYVNAVGAVGANRREVDDATMNATVIVESRAAALQESGDIIHSGAPIYAELGELLAKQKPLSGTGSRIVFKSLGIAAEDIAAAKMVYERARASTRL